MKSRVLKKRIIVRVLEALGERAIAALAPRPVLVPVPVKSKFRTRSYNPK
jgi:hypothetical protein